MTGFCLLVGLDLGRVLWRRQNIEQWRRDDERKRDPMDPIAVKKLSEISRGPAGDWRLTVTVDTLWDSDISVPAITGASYPGGMTVELRRDSVDGATFGVYFPAGCHIQALDHLKAAFDGVRGVRTVARPGAFSPVVFPDSTAENSALACATKDATCYGW